MSRHASKQEITSGLDVSGGGRVAASLNPGFEKTRNRILGSDTL
jgi:hypothetical protein